MRQSRVRKNRRNTRGRGRGRSLHGRRTSSSSQYSELGLAGSLVGASALSQGSELEVEFQDQSSQSFIGGRGRSGGGSSGAGRKPGCVNDIADHILCFLELLNTIKIYHWSTLSYPTHKATDELHDTLSKLVDSFIETYIGHCARGGVGAVAAGSGVPVFKFKSEKDSCISFCQCKTHDAFCKILDENIIHLEGLTDKLNGYTDLVNIRDEMVGALAQALYLLRLN
jgi:hypothetical protein